MHMKRILVIEPAENFRNALVTILQIEGFHALGVGTVQEACQKMKKRSFSVVLVGLNSALDPSDQQLLERFNRRSPGVPVVVLGNECPGIRSDVIERQKTGDFHWKPLELRDIREIIRFVNTVTAGCNRTEARTWDHYNSAVEGGAC